MAAAAAAADEPEVIRDKAEMRAWSRRRRAEGKTVVLVPTMGFLHEGHLALVSAAAASVSGPVAVVVSIYVNPSQFAPTEDLATYPSDLAGDLRKLASTGAVHAVFNPPDLYFRGRGAAGSGRRAAEASGGAAVSCLEEAAGGDGHETWIRVERLEKGLCGSSRPVFFRGVATVVAKLFNVVEPDVAVFGKKDYQQWRLICRMVRDLDFSIEIIGSEIVREADGLAMSSRNVYLLPEQREKALSISRSLVNARTAALNNSNSASEHIKSRIVQTLMEAGGQVDYVEIVEQESLVPVETIDRPVVICVATWFGKTEVTNSCLAAIPRRIGDSVKFWDQREGMYQMKEGIHCQDIYPNPCVLLWVFCLGLPWHGTSRAGLTSTPPMSQPAAHHMKG